MLQVLRPSLNNDKKEIWEVVRVIVESHFIIFITFCSVSGKIQNGCAAQDVLSLDSIRLFQYQTYNSIN
jgi:hypothetical protein